MLHNKIACRSGPKGRDCDILTKSDAIFYIAHLRSLGYVGETFFLWPRSGIGDQLLILDMVIQQKNHGGVLPFYYEARNSSSIY